MSNKKQRVKQQQWKEAYKSNLKQHFSIRFKERMGFDLHPVTYENLKNHFKSRPSNGAYRVKILESICATSKIHQMHRRWYHIQYEDAYTPHFKLWVLVDYTLKEMVTVLPDTIRPELHEVAIHEDNSWEKKFEESLQYN